MSIRDVVASKRDRLGLLRPVMLLRMLRSRYSLGKEVRHHPMITETRITIETPEGAELPLTPVGVGARIAAFAIDVLIRAGVNIALATVLGVTGHAGMGISLIFFFLLEWFYPVVFEVWFNGQTPGKKQLDIAVVNDDGTPVSFAASLLRNLLRVVDFLPMAYITALVCCMSNKHFKRVGDLAAGTLVVYVGSKRAAPTIAVDEALPVPSDFSTEEQRALLEFVERCPQLSQERQAELASILAPLVGTRHPTATLLKMANSLLGAR